MECMSGAGQSIGIRYHLGELSREVVSTAVGWTRSPRVLTDISKHPGWVSPSWVSAPSTPIGPRL